MTIFRPCIDLHQGKVKQIIGSSLQKDNDAVENFSSEKPASWFAELYQKDDLRGGHIIKLGPGNDEQALGALNKFPNGLQVGGGINLNNAESFLDQGASQVIITSWIIPGLEIDWVRLGDLRSLIGLEKIVLDLSCRKKGDGWFIAKDGWQTITNIEISMQLINKLQEFCCEFLIHAVDVEGKQEGIDSNLVKYLGQIVDLPTTYAGGANRVEDLEEVRHLSSGKIDLTIGSALDIFGGTGVRYQDCIVFNRQQAGFLKK